MVSDNPGILHPGNVHEIQMYFELVNYLLAKVIQELG